MQRTEPERFDPASSSNADYLDRLYQQYQRDPRSVDETTRAYFAGFDLAVGRVPGSARRGIMVHPLFSSTLILGETGQRRGVGVRCGGVALPPAPSPRG